MYPFGSLPATTHARTSSVPPASSSACCRSRLPRAAFSTTLRSRPCGQAATSSTWPAVPTSTRTPCSLRWTTAASPARRSTSSRTSPCLPRIRCGATKGPRHAAHLGGHAAPRSDRADRRQGASPRAGRGRHGRRRGPTRLLNALLSVRRWRWIGPRPSVAKAWPGSGFRFAAAVPRLFQRRERSERKRVLRQAPSPSTAGESARRADRRSEAPPATRPRLGALGRRRKRPRAKATPAST